MNRISFLSTLLTLIAAVGLAQTTVKLKIHHKLGNEAFALNTGAKNNLGDDFEVTRMEYYISEVSVIHDNGMSTAIPDLWILVNAAAPTEVELGNYPITEVEGFHFTIGVDPDHNHLDPASYDPSHPLAPKNPSMHWGWASGYRFMAFEGNGGSNYDQLIQLHGLGDQNYIRTKLLLTTSALNNEVVINLDADYTRVLEDLSVNTGLIVHSELFEAQQSLVNLRNLAFTPTQTNTSTTLSKDVCSLNVFPNPAYGGQTNVYIESPDGSGYTISVTDLMGRQTAHFPISSDGHLELDLARSGFYFVHLLKDGKWISSRKLIAN